jgi:nitronate monooxygenase
MEVPWRLPLMQAPIGPAGTIELVAAVSGSGALGTLAASWTPVADLREQVRWLRSRCSAAFCVNLVLAFEQRERLAAVLDEGAPVVSFSWGLDAALISAARSAGAYVLAQVATLVDARSAVAAGADALILQGVEAGGHVQATRPLLELLREIRPVVDVPLLAAGGIAAAGNRDDAREAGADAVACGTAFLAAEEANVHPVYFGHLVAAGTADTTLTTIFDGGWRGAPHRVIRNDTVARWEATGKCDRGHRPGEGDQIASRNGQPVLRYDNAQPTRETSGEVSLMAMYAGTSVQAITQVEPASQIVKRITQGL